MRAVVQRVSFASVNVSDSEIAKIDKGLVVLIGVASDDNEYDAGYIATKILGLRIFPDEQDKMNMDISLSNGDVLLVSQFTLMGDARRGQRPDFSMAAKPDLAKDLINKVLSQIQEAGVKVKTGIFGAHMRVKLENNGPVTILLDSKKGF